jgi:hypothetical protein
MLDATCIVVVKNHCANNEFEGKTKDMVNLHSFNSVFESDCEIVH